MEEWQGHCDCVLTYQVENAPIKFPTTSAEILAEYKVQDENSLNGQYVQSTLHMLRTR